MLEIADRGRPGPLLERTLGIAGYHWTEAGPADPADRGDYVARRRRGDPDLWVVELDHPDARRIALELLQ